MTRGPSNAPVISLTVACDDTDERDTSSDRHSREYHGERRKLCC